MNGKEHDRRFSEPVEMGSSDSPEGDAKLGADIWGVDEALCRHEVLAGDAEGRQELSQDDLLELGNDDIADKVKLGVLGHVVVCRVRVDGIADAVVLAQPNLHRLEFASFSWMVRKKLTTEVPSSR